MKVLLDKDAPTLRKPSQPVSLCELSSPWLHALVTDLLMVMQEQQAVGIAAPQIGVNKRVIIFGTSYTKRRKIEQPIPDTVLINPSFNIISNKIQTDYEGCLNIAEVRALVPRAMFIDYSGYQLDGHFFTKQASGLEARIIQHEVDHLDGILYIDRVEDKTSFTTVSELRKG